MNICLGIISWLPSDPSERLSRSNRLNKLLLKLEELWPTLDILIIAQNWKEFSPVSTSNNLIIKNYENGLGILTARKELRLEFLNRAYDYIITFDDDCLIEAPGKTAERYVEYINEHPNGFCFIRGSEARKYGGYRGAQLNLCAISRYIYEREDLPDLDPQNGGGFEDAVFSCLLHYKYPYLEFHEPSGLTHTQFQNQKEPVKSTWYDSLSNNKKCCLVSNTNAIKNYIVEHHELPENIKEFLEKNQIKLNSTNDKLTQFSKMYKFKNGVH